MLKELILRSLNLLEFYHILHHKKKNIYLFLTLLTTFWTFFCKIFYSCTQIGVEFKDKLVLFFPQKAETKEKLAIQFLAKSED